MLSINQKKVEEYYQIFAETAKQEFNDGLRLVSDSDNTNKNNI